VKNHANQGNKSQLIEPVSVAEPKNEKIALWLPKFQDSTTKKDSSVGPHATEKSVRAQETSPLINASQ
jgi:hypothetical protein